MSQHCGRDEHSRDVKARVDETNYSRLRKAIDRNQKVVMEFQDRQIGTPVAGIVLEQFAAEA